MATKQIAEKISFVEETTRKSAQDIASTSRKITDIAGISKELQSSVDEQATATSNIAAGVNRAAQNSTIAAEVLKTVAGEITLTQGTAKSVLAAAQELSQRMREMDDAMEVLLQASSQQHSMHEFPDLQREDPSVGQGFDHDGLAPNLAIRANHG